MRAKLTFPLILALCLSTYLLFSQSDDPDLKFRLVTREAGVEFSHINGPPLAKKYLFEAKGGGAAFFDYDGDGWMDLLLTQGSTLERHLAGDDPHSVLLRNQGDGTFVDVSREAGITSPSWAMGVAIGDYNNDGHPDIYLTCLGPNLLYRNDGDGTFTDVTEAAGIGDPFWSTSAAFADFNNDGYLDLYVCNYVEVDLDNLPLPDCLYRGQKTICGPRDLPGAEDRFYWNNGDGTFTQAAHRSGAWDQERGYGLGVVTGDVNNDGHTDIYVANDFGPNYLFLNQRDGTFQEVGYVSGLALSGDGMIQAGMGVDIADYDNDGLQDLYSTHFAGDYSTLYRNRGELLFEDATASAGIQTPEWFLVSWGTRFADFDLDGFKDIVHANGHVYPYLSETGLKETYRQPTSFYLNRGDGTFEDFSGRVGTDLQKPLVGRGMAFADYDNDGDLDFVIANLNGRPALFRNDLPVESRQWVTFRTRGHVNNRDGIGTRIELIEKERRQVWEVKRTVGIFSASDPRAHFGLGSAKSIPLVKVVWPSGKSQEFKNVRAGQHYLLDEEKGLLPQTALRAAQSPVARTR